MFEDMTYEVILKRALALVPSTVDKRQGSVIYDALAPCCAELAQLYISLNMAIDEAFADTASREYLIRRAKERGISPKKASPAVMRGVFNMEVPLFTRFFINGLYFYVSEKISDFEYRLICETDGSDGHRCFGRLIPAENIEGLTTAEITDVIIPGEDEEETENFRERYFQSFGSLAFGGNKQDYIEKTNSISGVGGCKVIPCFNGAGTVKLIIISSDYSEPSGELTEYVGECANPKAYDGEGEGFAPIGHRVTVCGVEQRGIDVKLFLELKSGELSEITRNLILENIKGYFKELSKGWADTDKIEVIAMRVGTEAFSAADVKAVSSVVLDEEGSFCDVVLEYDEIPILSSLFINGEEVYSYA